MQLNVGFVFNCSLRHVLKQQCQCNLSSPQSLRQPCSEAFINAIFPNFSTALQTITSVTQQP